MSFSAKITADLFRRTMAAASTEETRFYLQGVYITPAPQGGVYLVATDGHCLLQFHDAAGECDGSAIIRLPANLLKLCTAPRRGDPEPLVLTTENEKVVAEIAGQTARDVAIDGAFPDYGRVIPNYAPAMKVHGAFNAKLVARIAEALALDNPRAPSLALYAVDASSPHLAFGTHPDGLGVVMPLRHAPTPPAWVKRA